MTTGGTTYSGTLEKKEMVAGSARCVIDGKRYIVTDERVLLFYRKCNEGDRVEYGYKGSALTFIRPINNAQKLPISQETAQKAAKHGFGTGQPPPYGESAGKPGAVDVAGDAVERGRAAAAKEGPFIPPTGGQTFEQMVRAAMATALPDAKRQFAIILQSQMERAGEQLPKDTPIEKIRARALENAVWIDSFSTQILSPGIVGMTKGSGA